MAEDLFQEVDFLRFEQIGNDISASFKDGEDYEEVKRPSLLAVSSHRGLYAVATPTTVIVGCLDKLYGELEDATKGSTITPSSAVSLPFDGAHQVVFSKMGHYYLVVATKSGSISSYKASLLLRKKSEDITPHHTLDIDLSSADDDQIIDIATNPSKLPNTLAVLTSMGKVHLVSIVPTKDDPITLSCSAKITAICWSKLGSRLVCGDEDGTLTMYDTIGKLKRTVPLDPASLSSTKAVLSLRWLQKNSILAFYIDQDVEEGEDKYSASLITLSKGSATPTYTTLAEPCGAWGRETESTAYYNVPIYSWTPSVPEIVVCANAPSTDISCLGHASGTMDDQWCLLAPEDETARMFLPLSKVTDEDVSPVGFAIDFGSKEWPTCLVLDNELSLFAFRLRHTEEECTCLIHRIQTKGASGKDASSLLTEEEAKPSTPPPPPAPVSRLGPVSHTALTLVKSFDEEIQEFIAENTDPLAALDTATGSVFPTDTSDRILTEKKIIDRHFAALIGTQDQMDVIRAQIQKMNIARREVEKLLQLRQDPHFLQISTCHTLGPQQDTLLRSIREGHKILKETLPLLTEQARIIDSAAERCRASRLPTSYQTVSPEAIQQQLQATGAMIDGGMRWMDGLFARLQRLDGMGLLPRSDSHAEPAPAPAASSAISAAVDPTPVPSTITATSTTSSPFTSRTTYQVAAKIAITRRSRSIITRIPRTAVDPTWIREERERKAREMEEEVRKERDAKERKEKEEREAAEIKALVEERRKKEAASSTTPTSTPPLLPTIATPFTISSSMFGSKPPGAPSFTFPTGAISALNRPPEDSDHEEEEEDEEGDDVGHGGRRGGRGRRSNPMYVRASRRTTGSSAYPVALPSDHDDESDGAGDSVYDGRSEEEEEEDHEDGAATLGERASEEEEPVSEEESSEGETVEGGESDGFSDDLSDGKVPSPKDIVAVGDVFSSDEEIIPPKELDIEDDDRTTDKEARSGYDESSLDEEDREDKGKAPGKDDKPEKETSPSAGLSRDASPLKVENKDEDEDEDEDEYEYEEEQEDQEEEEEEEMEREGAGEVGSNPDGQEYDEVEGEDNEDEYGEDYDDGDVGNDGEDNFADLLGDDYEEEQEDYEEEELPIDSSEQAQGTGKVDSKEEGKEEDKPKATPAPAFSFLSAGGKIGIGSKAFGTPAFSSNSTAFGTSTSTAGVSAFGQPANLGEGSAFGASTSTPGASAFGAPTSTSGGSAFGQPAKLGEGSAFSASTSTPGTSAFGQPAKLGEGSAFGASIFTPDASAFGQPAKLGGGSAFGSSTSAPGASAFGQSAKLGEGSAFGSSTSTAGASAFGQSAKFGEGSAFGASTSTPGTSAFGEPAKLGGGSAFGSSTFAPGASAFGQPAKLGEGSAFGVSTSTPGASAFGQPAKLGGGSAFGQPAKLGGGSTFGSVSTSGGASAFAKLAGPAASFSSVAPSAPEGGSIFGSGKSLTDTDKAESAFSSSATPISFGGFGGGSGGSAFGSGPGDKDKKPKGSAFTQFRG